MNLLLFYILIYSSDDYISGPRFTYKFENSSSDTLIKEIYYVSLTFLIYLLSLLSFRRMIRCSLCPKALSIWFTLKMDQIFIQFKYNSECEESFSWLIIREIICHHFLSAAVYPHYYSISSWIEISLIAVVFNLEHCSLSAHWERAAPLRTFRICQCWKP